MESKANDSRSWNEMLPTKSLFEQYNHNSTWSYQVPKNTKSLTIHVLLTMDESGPDLGILFLEILNQTILRFLNYELIDKSNSKKIPTIAITVSKIMTSDIIQRSVNCQYWNHLNRFEQKTTNTTWTSC